MDVPSNDVIRARSPVLTARYPDPAGDAGLTLLIAESAGVVSMLTGRAIGVTGEGPFGCQLEEVPDALVPLAARVVRLRAEGMDISETDVAARTAEEARRAAGIVAESLTAGPFSESFTYALRGASANSPEQVSLDPDPEVHAQLWALATDCARDGWIRLWRPELAGATEPFSLTYGLPWFPLDPFGPYRDPFW